MMGSSRINTVQRTLGPLLPLLFQIWISAQMSAIKTSNPNIPLTLAPWMKAQGC
jgi:hypothetical protein